MTKNLLSLFLTLTILSLPAAPCLARTGPPDTAGTGEAAKERGGGAKEGRGEAPQRGGEAE